jgi:hypothetical protein
VKFEEEVVKEDWEEVLVGGFREKNEKRFLAAGTGHEGLVCSGSLVGVEGLNGPLDSLVVRQLEKT